MRKLLQTLLLLGAAGCATPNREQYRYDYRPNQLITNGTHELQPEGGNIACLLENNRISGIGELMHVSFKKPLYIAAEITLPKEVQLKIPEDVRKEKGHEYVESGMVIFKQTYERNYQLSQQKYVLKETSASIDTLAINELINQETWKEVESQYALAGKDKKYLVFEIRRVRALNPTTITFDKSGKDDPLTTTMVDGKITSSKDRYAVTGISLALPDGTAHISSHQSEITYDAPEDSRSLAPFGTRYDAFRQDPFRNMYTPVRSRICDPRIKDHCQIRHK